MQRMTVFVMCQLGDKMLERARKEVARSLLGHRESVQ